MNNIFYYEYKINKLIKITYEQLLNKIIVIITIIKIIIIMIIMKMLVGQLISKLEQMKSMQKL